MKTDILSLIFSRHDPDILRKDKTIDSLDGLPEEGISSYDLEHLLRRAFTTQGPEANTSPPSKDDGINMRPWVIVFTVSQSHVNMMVSLYTMALQNVKQDIQSILSFFSKVFQDLVLKIFSSIIIDFIPLGKKVHTFSMAQLLIHNSLHRSLFSFTQLLMKNVWSMKKLAKTSFK